MDFSAEGVADIPLITEFCKRLKVDCTINEAFGTHGNQKNLSNGLLVIGWLAHALTESNHCKAPVKEWANNHKMVLSGLFEKILNENEFDDCRLSRLLERFADDQKWQNFESSFYNNTMSILQLDTKALDYFKDTSCKSDEGINKTIKCDSTTAYGHHKVIEDGIMQRGWSKDFRPDLPQLKLMVSVEGNTGTSIASQIVSGNTNDDILYIPIIERTRKTINTYNCLFCGDCKMSNLETRANIVQNEEFYLTPLQMNNEKIKTEFASLVDKVVNGDQIVELIFSLSEKDVLIGAGYEISRQQSYTDANGKFIEWSERVLVVRSLDHAKSEFKRFEEKVKKIKAEIQKTVSKQFKNKVEAENELKIKIEKILTSNNMKNVFEIEYEIQEKIAEKARGEIRGGKKREGTFKLVSYKAVIGSVKTNEQIIQQVKSKLGWRLYVTNTPKKYLMLPIAYSFYRETMYVVEIGFHRIKDYFNISPLFVWEEQQIIGMTRFLTLALKILTLMTAEIRANLKKNETILQGLYAGQKARKHEAPTAESILKYFSRQKINLIGIKKPVIELEVDMENMKVTQPSTNLDLFHNWKWMIDNLSDTCKTILKSLQLQDNIYDRLPDKIVQVYSRTKVEEKSRNNN